ncbi:hypothetical protein evm_013282 [Chilo suppressalis]|nr:hypothetical protein evm_013282 [Chilo suppressalis]
MCVFEDEIEKRVELLGSFKRGVKKQHAGRQGRTAVSAIFASGLHRHLTSGGAESFVGPIYKKNLIIVILTTGDFCADDDDDDDTDFDLCRREDGEELAKMLPLIEDPELIPMLAVLKLTPPPVLALQTAHLMVSDHRRPWTLATPGVSQMPCRPLRKETEDSSLTSLLSPFEPDPFSKTNSWSFEPDPFSKTNSRSFEPDPFSKTNSRSFEPDPFWKTNNDDVYEATIPWTTALRLLDRDVALYSTKRHPFLTVLKWGSALGLSFCNTSLNLWLMMYLSLQVPLSLGLALAALKRGPQSLARHHLKMELLEHDELLVDAAIDGKVFEYLDEAILSTDYVWKEEYYQRRIHTLITDFIVLMHSKLMEMRVKADEAARTLQMYMAEGLAPPAGAGASRTRLDALLRCVERLYRRDPLGLRHDYWLACHAPLKHCPAHSREYR